MLGEIEPIRRIPQGLALIEAPCCTRGRGNAPTHASVYPETAAGLSLAQPYQKILVNGGMHSG